MPPAHKPMADTSPGNFTSGKLASEEVKPGALNNDGYFTLFRPLKFMNAGFSVLTTTAALGLLFINN